MEAKKQANKYSPEFRASAVKLALESDSVTQAAVELGINKNTLHTWVSNHNRTNAKNGDQGDLLKELKKLKAENRRLKEEREILKKAAAYFAKDVR